tara:strand:- start:8548 stop:10452 length:1905 start_codon:yes stop_codon:yes gene_type:complete
MKEDNKEPRRNDIRRAKTKMLEAPHLINKGVSADHLSDSAVQNAKELLGEVVQEREPVVSEEKKKEKKEQGRKYQKTLKVRGKRSKEEKKPGLWGRMSNLVKKMVPGSETSAEEERAAEKAAQEAEMRAIEQQRLQMVREQRSQFQTNRKRPTNIGERQLNELNLEPENTMQRVVGKSQWQGARQHQLNSMRMAGLPADFELERQKTNEHLVGRAGWRKEQRPGRLKDSDVDQGMLEREKTNERVVGKGGWRGRAQRNHLNSLAEANVDTGMFKPETSKERVIGRSSWLSQNPHALNSIAKAMFEAGMLKPDTDMHSVIGRSDWLAMLPNELNDLLMSGHLTEYDLEDIYLQIMDPSWKHHGEGAPPDWQFMELQQEHEGHYRVDNRPLDLSRRNQYADYSGEFDEFDEGGKEWFDDDDDDFGAGDAWGGNDDWYSDKAAPNQRNSWEEDDDDYYESESAEYYEGAENVPFVRQVSHGNDDDYESESADYYESESADYYEGESAEYYEGGGYDYEYDDPMADVQQGRLYGDGRGYRMESEQRLPRRQVERTADRPAPNQRRGYVVDDMYRSIQQSGQQEYDVYVVAAGDSFDGIARRFGLTSDELLAWNPQINAKGFHTRIYVGMSLYVPKTNR